MPSSSAANPTSPHFRDPGEERPFGRPPHPILIQIPAASQGVCRSQCQLAPNNLLHTIPPPPSVSLAHFVCTYFFFTWLNPIPVSAADGGTLCLLAGGVLGLQVLEGEVGDDTAEEDNAVESNAAAS